MNMMLPPFRSLMVYPDSDGKPLSDNTKQGRWIILLFDNLCAMFHTRLDVFVAQNLLWYAVEGQPDLCGAPDVLIVFGRPKGDRGSYKQWEEANLPPTVVFEILSPGNSTTAMDKKFLFYEEHGVEEYYIYDPNENHLQIYTRQGEVLRRRRPIDSFVSPRLGIRFEMTTPEMTVWGPDNERFLTFEELQFARQEAQDRAEQAQKQAAEANTRAETAERKVALMIRLSELSRKARRGEATAEELAGVEQLEASLPQGELS